MVGSGFCPVGEGKRKRKLQGTGCRKPRVPFQPSSNLDSKLADLFPGSLVM